MVDRGANVFGVIVVVSMPQGGSSLKQLLKQTGKIVTGFLTQPTRDLHYRSLQGQLDALAPEGEHWTIK